MDKKAFISELVRLADQLDTKGLSEEANELDKIVTAWVSDPFTNRRRERGTHLPEWRKLQLEREEEEKEKPEVDQLPVNV